MLAGETVEREMVDEMTRRPQPGNFFYSYMKIIIQYIAIFSRKFYYISSRGAHTIDVGGDVSSAAMVLSEEECESNEHVNIVYKVGDPVVYNGEHSVFTDADGFVTLVGQVKE